MKVLEIMNRHARTCSPATHLAAVGQIMGDAACGMVTVVDDDRRVLGVLTDRDVCLAVATSDQRPSEIRVGQMMSQGIVTCREDEVIESALETMRRRELRRLPVLDADGRFAGLLALDDIVLEERLGGETAAHRADFYAELAATLKAICSHGTPGVVPWG